jgi:hypothetical protein
MRLSRLADRICSGIFTGLCFSSKPGPSAAVDGRYKGQIGFAAPTLHKKTAGYSECAQNFVEPYKK